MDNKRLHKKNQIVNEIKQIDVTMARDISSIDKLKHSRMDIDFIQNSIIKINLKVEEKKLRKKQLQEDLLKLEQGELDQDIQTEYNKSKLLIAQKNEEHKNKRAIIAQQKADDEEKTVAMHQHNRDINNTIKQQHRDIKYEEKRFFKMIESIPTYIDKNLDDMPNNKGYLWRGILLFGKQHTEIDKKEPLLIFDKQNKDNLLIHEWTETDYSLYKKIGKNPKTTISTKPRHIIKKSGLITDFIQNDPTTQTVKPLPEKQHTQHKLQQHKPKDQQRKPQHKPKQTQAQPKPQTQSQGQPQGQNKPHQQHKPQTQNKPHKPKPNPKQSQTTGQQTQSDDKNVRGKPQSRGGKTRGGRGGQQPRNPMPSLLKPEKT